MRFRREVGHPRKSMLVKQAAHQTGVGDVAFDEPDAVIRDQRFEASDIGGIGHRIDDDELVRRSCGPPGVHEVLADKARAAGDQNVLHPNPYIARKASSEGFVPKRRRSGRGLISQRQCHNQDMCL